MSYESVLSTLSNMGKNATKNMFRFAFFGSILVLMYCILKVLLYSIKPALLALIISVPLTIFINVPIWIAFVCIPVVVLLTLVMELMD